MKKIGYAIGAAALAVATHQAHAFCGFYVSGSGDKMFNDATNVVLMREGTRTVLSMQNDYKGPLNDFAMVVPVPVVLHEGDVKTLPREAFDHTDSLGSPRLVEYWEQNPCPTPYAMDKDDSSLARPTASMAPQAEGKAGRAREESVKIEAQFAVGEPAAILS